MTTRMPKLVGEGEEYEHLEGATEAYEREKAAEAAHKRRERIAERKAKPKPTPRQVEHPAGTPLQKGELRPTPVRAHTFNLDRAANPPRSLTKELTDMGLDIVPVYGTYRSAKALADQWQHLSTAQKISGVALTGMSAAGDVFIVVGAAKAGTAVIKVSARTARQSPHLVRRILTEETGAIRLGTREGVEVVSKTGRSSAGGVSSKLRGELDEVLRGKGFGEGAAPKATQKAGFRGPGAPKATEFIYVGPPGANSFAMPAALRRALQIPPGRYIATGASARITEGIITAYPKADPEQKARIVEQLHNDVQTGKIVLTDTDATATRVQTLMQKQTGTGTIITVVEAEQTGEFQQTKPPPFETPIPAPTKQKTTPPTPAPPKPPTPTPPPPPGRPRTPRPPRPIPPTPPRPFKFKGRTLPPGEYPRVVSYRQGFIRWHLDLDTGERRPERALGRPTADPWRSFRIEKTDRTPPKAQLIDLGLFDVSVTERGIGRFRPQDELRDRSTQPRKGRP